MPAQIVVAWAVHCSNQSELLDLKMDGSDCLQFLLCGCCCKGCLVARIRPSLARGMHGDGDWLPWGCYKGCFLSSLKFLI